MILDGDNTTRALFDRGADGLQIHAIDERIGDDSGGDVLLLELAARLDGPAHQRSAGQNDHVASAGQNLRLAPLIPRVFQPAQRIIFAPDKKDNRFAVVPCSRARAIRWIAWYISASASSAQEQAMTTVCGMAETAAK